MVKYFLGFINDSVLLVLDSEKVNYVVMMLIILVLLILF